MKHLLWTTLLFVIAGAGCVSDHHEITKVFHPEPEHAPPPPPPVTASQITADNAHHMSQALWDELDRSSQDELPNESNAKTPPSKK